MPVTAEIPPDVGRITDRETVIQMRRAIADGAPAPPGQSANIRFPIHPASALADLPATRWRIKHVLPESGLAAIYGPPGCGKSFLWLDASRAIAAACGAETSWFGHRVMGGRVLYLALEGEAGASQRLAAMRTVHGIPDELYACLAPFNLLDAWDREQFCTALEDVGFRNGVIGIDTLNRAANGADENDARDMSAIIDAAKAIQSRMGGLVVLIHHSGKDSSRGLRGHSSLLAAMDVVIEVSRDAQDRRAWKLVKSKDGSDGEARSFALDVVELGTDDDGEQITSCTVRELDGDAADTTNVVRPPQGGNQRLAWDALGDLFRLAGETRPPGAPDACPRGRPVVAMPAAVDWVGARLVVAREKDRRTRAAEAIRGLVSRRLLAVESDWLWCL